MASGSENAGIGTRMAHSGIRNAPMDVENAVLAYETTVAALKILTLALGKSLAAGPKKAQKLRSESFRPHIPHRSIPQ